MTVTNDREPEEQEGQPSGLHPAFRQLEPLLGRWHVTGENITGQVTFAWLEGGFFLMQHVDLVHDGRPITGIEYIGYDPASDTLRSHYFGNQSEVFEYTWEIVGDSLTIWGGERGSDFHYSGQLSVDGNTNAGRWQWPGGGYASTMARIAEDAT
jgi:hypothetical protein